MANEGTKEKLDIELEAPADFTSPEVLYQDLINTIRKYHPSDDITMIEKAYRIADEAHKEQKRKSGEPYIIHPLCVAIILADLEMDKETIAAGLLHDVVEDTIMTLEQLTKEFGSEVSFLVDGVTKLTQLNWDKDKDVFGHGKGHPRYYHQAGGPSSQHEDRSVLEAGEAKGKGQGDHGNLCPHRRQAGHFQD